MSELASMEGVPFSVSIVVPVFNGSRTLPELTERLLTVLCACSQDYEIIFVNDGSSDDSWDIIKGIARESPVIRGLNLMRNFGQHNALLAGITNARYECIVTIDDDLQHPPEEIPALLQALAQGNDVAYGKPKVREHGLARNMSSRVAKMALRIALGVKMAEASSAFRAFRAELKRGFANFADAKLSLDVLLSWSASQVACVPVDHHPRPSGRSGYTLRKLIGLTLSMMTGYSTLPLRFASGLGLVTAAFGIILFLYLIVKRLFQETSVPGFAFMASEIALFAGLQLFAIGVIGEYLARIHFRTMGKPPFVIRERTDNEPLS